MGHDFIPSVAANSQPLSIVTDKKKTGAPDESAAAKGTEEDWESELTNELDDFEVSHECTEARNLRLPLRPLRKKTNEGEAREFGRCARISMLTHRSVFVAAHNRWKTTIWTTWNLTARRKTLNENSRTCWLRKTES